MIPAKDKVLIIPAWEKRTGAAYCLMDLKTDKYMQMPLNNDTKAVADELKQYKCTLLYIHNKYNVYGVVKDSRGKTKPSLYWVSKDIMDELKDSTLNYKERYDIIDISDMDANVFSGNIDKKKFSIVRIAQDSKLGLGAKAENFIEKLKEVDKPVPVVQGGQSNVDSNTIVNKSDTIEEKKDKLVTDNKDSEKTKETVEIDNTKQLENKDEQLTSESKTKKKIKIDLNNQEDVVKTLAATAIALQSTMKELKKVAGEYKESMAKSLGTYDLDVETKFIGVSGLVSDKDKQIDELVSTEYDCKSAFYESMLKMLKVDDTVSIPREFYDKMVAIIRRNLMVSMDGNRYDSIVQLKFNRNDKENIVARVEYNAAEDFCRVAIIKPYNNIELSDQLLVDYEIKYNQWKRLHSYRTT